jgi:hypothetical protein
VDVRAVFTELMVDEHLNVVLPMRLELPKGARVQHFVCPSALSAVQVNEPTTIPLFLPYFTIIAEFNIRSPEEGLGRKVVKEKVEEIDRPGPSEGQSDITTRISSPRVAMTAERQGHEKNPGIGPVLRHFRVCRCIHS